MNVPRILIVDDSVANLKLASSVLAFEGYSILQAADALEAIKIIGEMPPDLILLDIGLPGMDGLALARRLKADPASRHIPVVAMTAYAMKGDQEKAREAGFDGYITKPIDTRLLARQVAEKLPSPQTL